MVNVSRPKSFLDNVGDAVNGASKTVEGWKNAADEKMRQGAKAVENAVPKPVGNAIKSGLEKVDEVRKAGHDSMDVEHRLSPEQKKVIADNREGFMNAAQVATGLAGAHVHNSQNKAIAKAEKENGTGGSGSKGSSKVGSKDKSGFAKSVAEGFANQTGIGTGYGSGDSSTRTQTQVSNPVAQSTAAQESQKGAEDVVSNQASKASGSTGSAPKTAQTVETANKTQGNANNPGNKDRSQMTEAERFRADNQAYHANANKRWGSSF